MRKASKQKLWGNGKGAIDLGMLSQDTSIPNILKVEKNTSYSNMTVEQDERRHTEKII